MDKKTLMNNINERMTKSLNSLLQELNGLRTGRASVNFLDPVNVEAYGARMHISQLATVSVDDAKTISVQVWDFGMTKAVEKAIVEANLGVSPAASGSVIRISLPPLSEERRKDLSKLCGKYGENAKVSIRNIRRDAMDIVKQAEKTSEISKDDCHNMGEEIQKVTDDYIAKIDEKVEAKEKEILLI
jgi:ribosome recycling factor